MKEFVLAWIESAKKGQGLQGVADKCDLTTVSAAAKASYLRKKGVKLPTMPRAKRVDVSVEALNQLIESRY